jgi:hypothetical protein
MFSITHDPSSVIHHLLIANTSLASQNVLQMYQIANSVLVLGPSVALVSIITNRCENNP